MRNPKGVPAEKQPLLIASALLFSFTVPAFGYIYLGPLVALLFLLGYLGGFVLWILCPTKAAYASIKIPYWTTLLAFLLLHKVEEKVTKFFEVLSEKITGVPVPEVTSVLVFGLLILPIGAWLAAPFLIKRGSLFGYRRDCGHGLIRAVRCLRARSCIAGNRHGDGLPDLARRHR